MRAEVINQYAGTPADGEELGIAPCPLDLKMIQRDGEYIACRMPFVKIPLDKHTAFLNNGNVPLETAFEAMSGGEPETVKHFDKLWIVLVAQEATTVIGHPYPVDRDDGRNVYTRQYEQYVEAKGNSGEHVVLRGLFVMPYTLSPYAPEIQAYRDLPKVDESKLFRYKFLAGTLPDPKSLYLINNRLYVCRQLNARFNINGMSQLIEGEFYLITA